MSLRQRIEEAFADVPYPGDDQIGANENDPICQELQADLQGRHWRDVSNEVLLKYEDEIPYNFKLAAFRFYLPAYLLASIEENEEWAIESFTIFSLTPPKTLDPACIDRFLARIRQFDPMQVDAITEFLRFKRDTYESEWDKEIAQEALDRYWEPTAEGRQIGIEDLIPPPGEGVTWIRMPDVIGKPADEARAILIEHGLRDPHVVEEWLLAGESPGFGNICATGPQPGQLAELSHQHVIYVTVPPPKEVQERNERAQAEQAAREAEWAAAAEAALARGERPPPKPFF